MGLVVRQSIFTTLISYAGAIIGYVNLFYLYPKFLEPEQVGLLRTVQDAAILFSPFAQFGLALSIFRFYPQLAKNKKSEASFISLILLLSLAGFAIFLITFKIFEQTILSYFEENARQIIEYTSIVLWLTFIILVTGILEAYSRSLLKTIFPNLLKEVVVRALLALLVTAYFFGWLSYHEFIISTVLAYLFCLLSLFAYLVREKAISFSLSFSAIQRGKIKELILYSLFSFAGTAGMIIIGKIDSLMVAGLIGLKSVAIYTTAFYMATVIEIPKKAMTAVAMPLIARAFEKEDFRDIATIYQKTSINQFIIGTILLIGVYINLDNIFELMPRKEIYESGRWVVIIVGVGKLVDMVFGPSSEIIVLSKYYWFNIVLIVVLAFTVISVNNLLIPSYGITGAALGAAFALITFNAIKFFFILGKLKIQPFSFSTGKVIIIGALTLAIHFLIPKIDSILVDIIIRSCIIGLFFAVCIFFSNVSPDANKLLRDVLTRLLAFFK